MSSLTSEVGERVIGGYEQTKRCLSFVPDNKRKADWLAVSHLTSATPTMFHVFMSLQYKTPVVVFTTQNRLLWKVDGGEVSPLAPGDASYDQYKRWSDGIEVEHEAVPTGATPHTATAETLTNGVRIRQFSLAGSALDSHFNLRIY